jgi:bifunctional non-homologous end joining protein LigD
VQDGLPGFEALRRRGAGEVAVLYAFDLLELDGDDLRNLPIETRKATLASLLRKPGALRLSEHISADGPQVFAHACRLGAEGIVSKRLGSPYRSGRHSGGSRRPQASMKRTVNVTVACLWLMCVAP